MAHPTSSDQYQATAQVSDAERDEAVQSLTTHVATGRLTLDKFDARAYASVTRGDLAALLADLPSAIDAAPISPKAARGHINREWLTWAGVGLLCLSIWAITSIAAGNFLYPWPVWVIGPWGAMLGLRHLKGGRMDLGCPSQRFYGG